MCPIRQVWGRARNEQAVSAMNWQAANILATSGRRPLLAGLARRVFCQTLSGLRHGRIYLDDPWESRWFGETGGLEAALIVRDAGFFRHLLTGGTLAAAESYLRGGWDCDDLTTLFRIFLRNRGHASRLDQRLARGAAALHRLPHAWRRNSLRGSRRNIGAHYDLGNDFFRLWLDDTLAYSSGIFVGPEASLREASLEKFDRVCRKLDLRTDDHILEIGSGWGGFAMHAAGAYGCRVTTTTISGQQAELARARIQAAGLSDRIRLVEQDYRLLRGTYDKLVSIEMIEAVGHRYLDQFFGQCSNLLTQCGSLVLQVIVMPEQGYRQYLRSADFIQRYVFPGGCLPSAGAMLAAVGRTTDLRLVHLEDFAPHYAETLWRWRQAFHGRLDDVRRLGYPERFIRMWDYYLCYCEAAFAERYISLLQIQFDKPDCQRDPGQISAWAANHSRPTASAGLAVAENAAISCGGTR